MPHEDAKQVSSSEPCRFYLESLPWPWSTQSLRAQTCVRSLRSPSPLLRADLCAVG
jgi:hypothetical protein